MKNIETKKELYDSECISKKYMNKKQILKLIKAKTKQQLEKIT